MPENISSNHTQAERYVVPERPTRGPLWVVPSSPSPAGGKVPNGRHLPDPGTNDSTLRQKAAPPQPRGRTCQPATPRPGDLSEPRPSSLTIPHNKRIKTTPNAVRARTSSTCSVRSSNPPVSASPLKSLLDTLSVSRSSLPNSPSPSSSNKLSISLYLNFSERNVKETSFYILLLLSTSKSFHSTTSRGASLMAQTVKNPLVMQETQVRSLDLEDTLEKGNGNPLAWRIPEEPGGLQSTGSQRVGHN